jgi:hypothetical protein
VLLIRLEELQNESQKLFSEYKSAVQQALAEDLQVKPVPEKLMPRVKTVRLKPIKKNESSRSSSPLPSSSGEYY